LLSGHIRGRIPYLREQGFKSEEQGDKSGEQGIKSAAHGSRQRVVADDFRPARSARLDEWLRDEEVA